MADIDINNPLPAIWPQRPVRRLDPEDESEGERRRRNRPGRHQKKKEEDKDDNNGHPRIDEYV